MVFRRSYRPRTTRRSPYRKLGVRKNVFKKKSLPGRFRAGSYKKYSKTRAVSRMLKNYGESIYSAMTPVDEIAPTNQIGTTTAFYQGWVLGSSIPTGWTGFSALGGMAVAQGTSTNQRVGQWAYLTKATATLSLDVKPNTLTNDTEPIEFRVILFKAKAGSRQFGTTYTPDATLMYNTSGQEFGPQSTGITATDVMLQPLNTRRWSIYKHHKFILSPPGEAGAANTSYYYPSRKILKLTMPFYKKIRFNVANEPQDVDTHYAIMIFSTPIAKFSAGNRYEANIRGTVIYRDS